MILTTFVGHVVDIEGELLYAAFKKIMYYGEIAASQPSSGKEVYWKRKYVDVAMNNVSEYSMSYVYTLATLKKLLNNSVDYYTMAICNTFGGLNILRV
ncbi:MAG: hypothetical protein ACLU4J_11160 [Butyricimonas paravirosa]